MVPRFNGKGRTHQTQRRARSHRRAQGPPPTMALKLVPVGHFFAHRKAVRLSGGRLCELQPAVQPLILSLPPSIGIHSSRPSSLQLQLFPAHKLYLSAALAPPSPHSLVDFVSVQQPPTEDRPQSSQDQQRQHSLQETARRRRRPARATELVSFRALKCAACACVLCVRSYCCCCFSFLPFSSPLSFRPPLDFELAGRATGILYWAWGRPARRPAVRLCRRARARKRLDRRDWPALVRTLGPALVSSQPHR